jgi:hypothetical protein
MTVHRALSITFVAQLRRSASSLNFVTHSLDEYRLSRLKPSRYTNLDRRVAVAKSLFTFNDIEQRL